ncbi:hypothetical protein OIU82_01175 [Escherichia coli]|nr:hypothetical protein [Escherichia coli]
MNAAIFRFFFTLAPESGRLAREKRNGKQRLKASQWRLFCMRVLKNKKPVSSGVIVAARLDTASAEKPERI